MIPRDYQRDAVNAVVSMLRTNRSVIGVAATGLGKTFIFSLIAGMAKGRVLIVCPTRELVTQTAEKLEAVTGKRPEIEMADQASMERGALWTRPKFVVASKASLHPNRLKRFDRDAFSIVVPDECHYSVATGWRTIFEHFNTAKIFGVTATPNRHDGIAMENVYEAQAFEYTLPWAVEHGWLCEPLISTPTTLSVKLPDIPETRRDFTDAEMAKLFEEEGPCHEVVQATIAAAKDRKTIVFGPSVAAARLMCEITNRKANRPGLAGFIHAETSPRDRKPILEAFRRGDLRYLFNFGIFTHGFDEPEIECVSIARMTKSLPLVMQMVGRGTRTWPGTIDGIDKSEDRLAAIKASPKPNLAVVDFKGLCGGGRLATIMDAMAGRILTDDEREEAAAILAGNPSMSSMEVARRAVDIVEARNRQREDEERERREAQRLAGLALDVRVGFHTQSAFANLGFDRKDVVRRLRTGVEKKPLTPKEKDWIKRQGFRPDRMTLDEQRAALGELKRRHIAGLCSPKQVACLRRAGYADADRMTKAEAKPLLDAIFAGRNNARSYQP